MMEGNNSGKLSQGTAGKEGNGKVFGMEAISEILGMDKCHQLAKPVAATIATSCPGTPLAIFGVKMATSKAT
jgi:hypothetical protein